MDNIPSSSRQLPDRESSSSKEREERCKPAEVEPTSPGIDVQDLVRVLEEDEPQLSETQNDRAVLESVTLLGIFPEEVWEMILDTVQDSSDLENICNASTYFREILSPRRAMFLFPKVWNILSVQYDANHQHDAAFDESQVDLATSKRLRCESCGKTRTIKWYSGILKLRLVCQAWCTVIDAILQERLYDILLELPGVTEPVGNGLVAELQHAVYAFSTQTSADPSRFVQHFQGSHAEEDERSPFIVGSIKIDFGLPPTNRHTPRFINGLNNILRRYGRHILNCECRATRLSSAAVFFFTFVQGFRESMVNLVNLYIFCPRAWTQSEIEETIRMNMEMRRNVVLRIPSLQRIETNFLLPQIFNSFIMWNSHVTFLKIKRNRGSEEYNIYDVSMPNLQELSITYYSEADFQRVENPQVTWPLRSLHLDLQGLPKFMLVSRVFNLLSQKWNDSLRNLWLELPTKVAQDGSGAHDQELGIIDYQHDLQNLRLDLPLVTSLKLTIGSVFSFDCLLPMTESLEFLDVKIDCLFNGNYKHFVGQAEFGRTIKFLSCDGRLLESNVWEHFTKLQQVKVCANGMESIFTRREWKMNKK